MPVDIDSQAGDHDFHVVSLTPSVTLLVDFDGIDTSASSFYRGQAYVSLKDSIFQPSTAERHVVELRVFCRVQNKAGMIALSCL